MLFIALLASWQDSSGTPMHQDHILSYGVVERTVIQQGGSFHILTQGGGQGYLGGVNILFDEIVWGQVDQNVIDRFK